MTRKLEMRCEKNFFFCLKSRPKNFILPKIALIKQAARGCIDEIFCEFYSCAFYKTAEIHRN